ncbi:UDP-D-xylose:ribitol-5-phosphate beta1,4-xylosyltransferase [Anabarilius grahami]|uniref:UDP-D-xylose:ribitol-5-phosphate beta1,4-xylosyltransferase n=1 Tax=Anabarilius grahami TaxID=495550 RepID=A0A3N0YAX9_ANAGA|nr:UDP-D-xylose:ribitol-5-phosphate beta1,4-xylosyltransferase [Anabarilius grahami]
MRFFRRKIAIIVVLAYAIFSLYAAYNVFFNKRVISRVHRVVKKGTVILDNGKGGEEEWNPWEEDERAHSLVLLKRRDAFRSYQDHVAKNRPKTYKVQIWGKAAIGNFYTGPAVVQGHVSLDTDSVVLVLNGREQQKISYSIQWLQHVQGLVQARTVSRVAVVLLGNERCNNDWISPYLKRHGGFVDLLFLVYDSLWVNDKDIFQWPLGVATWLPQETADTSRQYQMALAQSDLTLCPVGVNTECYRIYEACAYGSVPVVEDVLTPGACAVGNRSPLRLLKDAGAPFIFLKDWRELPAILERERGMNQKEKTERRMRLLEWYSGFRQQMKDKFTEVLEEAFFKIT